MKTVFLKATFLTSLGLSALAGAAPAIAQSADAADTQDEGSDGPSIVVTGARDIAGVVMSGDSASVFGLDTPIVDTPRSITEISDKLLSRYNIKTVYDFTSVAAGTYTGSYFGVPGAIAIRGSVADNYFNGFQGISNFANFPTPVDSSANIEIVRGPPSPIYGAGQVGGFLNFIPKSGRGEKTKYVQDITGDMSVTYGSYNQREATANLALPVKLGENEGGLALYGKLEDSDSFYRGMHPKSQVGQATYSSDFGDHLSVSLSYQYLHSDGYLKNIGWNRVTQDLIDNRNYISGRPIASIVAPGANFITAAQFYERTGGSPIVFYAPAIGVGFTPNEFTELDPATVKIVKLSPRDTMLDEEFDINEARTHTGYGSIAYTFDGGNVLKFESFINTLNSENYQSYGFGTVFDATVTEQRLTDKFDVTLGKLEIQTIVGASYRYTKSHETASLDDFAVSEDRRDISVGATPDDRFNDPFRTPGYQWATAHYSRVGDLAGFFVSNATLGPVGLTVGGRIDNYKVRAINTGTASSAPTDMARDEQSPFSYNASLNYKFPWATFYGTYARSYSLQMTQGGSINPSLIPDGSYLGPSKLKEIGVKTSQFGGRLFASLDAYEQQRSFLSTPATGVPTVSQLRTRGIEAELRWLMTPRFGITATGAYQRTRQMPTEGAGTFITMPSCLTDQGCTAGYGGYIYSLTNYMGLTDGYYLRSSPKYSGSLFATYDAKGHWGLTGGVTYASETGGFLPGAIELPSYALVKVGAYVTAGRFRFDFNVDNLTDKLYFMANSDTDANANVLPGIGRTFHGKLTYSF